MKLPDSVTYAAPHYHPMVQRFIRFAEHLSGRTKVKNIYESIPDETIGKADFYEEMLEKLNIELVINQDQDAQIPESGPLVFIANHPFGLLDGMVVSMLAAGSRPNWSILINDVVSKFDDFKDYLLPISFSDSREAAMININTKKQALNLLKEGGAVVVFPSGGVATSEGVFGPITDIEWKLFPAKLIQQSKATVIPIYIHGTNSRKFHVVSQFNYFLRVALYLHEMMRRQDTSQEITIGKPITHEVYSQFKKRQQLIDFLRAKVFEMAPPHVVKVRKIKNYLDAEIGQPFDEIRKERRQLRRSQIQDQLKRRLKFMRH
ncbi:MAG: lysophospholipid acyltransferase family protein [Chloroflexota bacterium]